MIRATVRHPASEADRFTADTLGFLDALYGSALRLVRASLGEDLRSALDALPKAYREAIWLPDVGTEIASVLNIPNGTVRPDRRRRRGGGVEA
ncbi:MAG: hypothetical protein ABW318_19355 [Vicinamibacterales bacterium]